MKNKCTHCGKITASRVCDSCGFDISLDMLAMSTLTVPTELDRVKLLCHNTAADNRQLSAELKQYKEVTEALSKRLDALEQALPTQNNPPADVKTVIEDLQPTQPEMATPASKPHVGNTVIFGAYQQSTSEKEPIEWLVLDEDDEKLLVLSKFALAYEKYNTSYIQITWGKCTLHNWLNNDFYNAAFSAEEKAKIAATNVSADNNLEFGTNPGNATNDKVFLLSITEAEKYFSTDQSRKCVSAVLKEYEGRNANCFWWLRSPGRYQVSAAIVRTDGSISYIGNGVNSLCNVRPALWINCDS